MSYVNKTAAALSFGASAISGVGTAAHFIKYGSYYTGKYMATMGGLTMAQIAATVGDYKIHKNVLKSVLNNDETKKKK